MTSTFRHLSASAERSTNKVSTGRERVNLPAGRNFLQWRETSASRSFNRCAARLAAQRKLARLIAPLRQNQQQDLRVNTGKDFWPEAVFTQLKTTSSQTETEWLHHFYLRERYYLSTREIASCTRCKLSLTIAKEVLISADPQCFWPTGSLV